MLFDEPYYLEINQARWDAVAEELRAWVRRGDRSCLDVGCGPGWFAGRLAGLGLDVLGVDGRPRLVAEARARAPAASFQALDIEDTASVSALGRYDLVFCFGLLYHVENPFRVVRNLRAVTRRVLVLESILMPDPEPVARLVSEGRNETQGLTHVALIPSLSALLKMMSAAGFGYLYELERPVPHADFRETEDRQRRRRILAASDELLDRQRWRALAVPDAPKFDFSRGQGR
jgi:SAM-dependent methyltransferase